MSTTFLIIFVIITALFFIAVLFIWAFIWGKFIKDIVQHGLVREPIPKTNLTEFSHYSVSRIMRTNPLLTASPEETVHEVMHKMRRGDVRFMPVMDGEKIAGVITDGDIIKALCGEGFDPENAKVSSIMTREVVTVKPSDNMGLVMKLMTAKQIRHLPVTDEGKLVGVVTLTDIGFKESGPFSMA